MQMLSAAFEHEVTADINFGGNVYLRRNKTNSFNGDISEFSVCELQSGDTLLSGLEDDGLEALTLDEDDVCEGQFASTTALEDFLNTAATQLGTENFNLEDLGDELSGTGVLAGAAINNISVRTQDSSGLDFQWTLHPTLFGKETQLIAGGAYYRGQSEFNSVMELSDIDSVSRLTKGFGTGTFITFRPETARIKRVKSSRL